MTVVSESCLTQFLCQTICTQRIPKGPKYWLNEHGIRHCQEWNSQPVPSKAKPIPLGHSDGYSLLQYIHKLLKQKQIVNAVIGISFDTVA